MLQSLRKLFIDSYVWVSLGAVLLSAMSRDIAGQTWSLSNLIFSFSGTLAIYNFHRWFKVEGNNYRSSKFYLFLISSLIAFRTLFYLERWEAVLFIGTASILSILYIVPFSVFSNLFSGIPMRERKGWKLWVIALTWSIVTVFIPLFWSDVEPASESMVLLWIERLCFIAAITIPFDIRDVYLDDPRLLTIPQQYGTRKSLFLAAGLLCVSAVTIVLMNRFMILPTISMVALIFADLLALVFIVRSKTQREKWYYAFVLDGLMIIHPMIYFIAQNI